MIVHDKKDDQKKEYNEANAMKYEKPGIISNKDLMVEEGPMKGQTLKPELVEHFDFVVVSCEIWKHLYAWYSADQPIVRFLKRDQFNKKSYFLDLYPLKSHLQ